MVKIKHQTLIVVLVMLIFICFFIITLNLLGCSKEINSETKDVSKSKVIILNEYKLLYENPIDGGTIEKKVSLDDKNIEEQIVYELFKSENIPNDLHSALLSNKLSVLNVEYLKEEKKVKIDFNKELLYYEGQNNDVRYFHSALYDTLAQFTSVEYIDIFVDGKFVEGLGELILSGKIHREN